MSQPPTQIETGSPAAFEVDESAPAPSAHPLLWPPRASPHFGDYSIRDFAARFLIQLDDFAEIERYRVANDAVRASADARSKVVLMGDSIIDFWPLGDLPAPGGLHLINRGVAGQNSSVMLLRFQADVLDLSPAAVVILAGTNDLRAYAGDPDAITAGALERLARNLTAMTNMAAGQGVAVALATLPPVSGDLAAVARSPVAIRSVNAWIADFARRRGLSVADYHAALSDADGLLPTGLSEDGLHPNPDGYRRMAPALLEVLAGLAADLPASDPAP